MGSQGARRRARVVRIIDQGDATTILGADGVTRRFDGDSAVLVRAVLEAHALSCTRAELFDSLRRLAEGGQVPEAPVDELLVLLERAGVLVDASADAAPSPPPLLSRRVVVGISGAVAAVDAPTLVRGLLGAGAEVRAALTRTARRFVTAEALEALTHQRAYRGLWDGDATCPVPHVNLAEWAELVVVCPASATSLARMARGDASDLVAAIVCATRAPVVIVPSMNDAMRTSPAVVRNLETLRGDGRYLVHPAMGVEVAHRPAERTSLLGPAPPPAAVLDVIAHVLAHRVE
jgi:3-polyprenyl-4-hydroxybenzoate decarboxylase